MVRNLMRCTGVPAVILVALVAVFAFPEQSRAQTVNCTLTENPASSTAVLFDHSALTCSFFNDANAFPTQLDDIAFNFNPGGTNEQIFVGTGAATSATAHQGCTLGGTTAAAGGSCNNNQSTNGNFTGSVSVIDADGKTVTFNVAYTVSGGGASIDITSGTITLTAPSSGSDNTDSRAAQRAVQASVSRSQSTVVNQNVGSRISSATGGTPSGAVDTDPRAIEETPETGFAEFTLDRSGRNAPNSVTGTTFRELAMLASFDTSRVLSAVENSADPLFGGDQRVGVEAAQPLTLWGHGSFTSVENDRNQTDDDARYDGDVWGYNLGMDYRFQSNLVAGISVGYAQTDITTTFNSGTYDETSWTLSPYAIFQPTSDITLSAVGGYGFGDVERSRDNGVTGTTDSTSWFLSLKGGYELLPIEDMPLSVTLGLGALLSRKKLEEFTQSDGSVVAESITNTIQLKPSVEAAYRFDLSGTSLQPFLKADYLHDFTDMTNGDAGAFDLGGGLRVSSSETGLSGALEGSRLVGRDDYTEYSFSGLVAYGFDLGGKESAELGVVSPYLQSSFSQDGQQDIGTGVSFAGFGGALTSKLSLNQSLATSTTEGRFNLNLTF